MDRLSAPAPVGGFDGLAANCEDANAADEKEVREEVGALVRRFPIYD